MATIGEIAKSHGFDNPSDFVNHVNRLTKEARDNSFNIGDKIRLKDNFEPTYYKYEEVFR